MAIKLRMAPPFAFLLLVAVLLLASCGDNGEIVGGESEAAPETIESLKTWVDSQDVIVAPWAVEIDGAALDAATIEENRLVFSNTPENQALLDLQQYDIVHGFSQQHMIGILDRVEAVKTEGDQIIVETSPASLPELYLKLTPGASFPETAETQQPLERAPDAPGLQLREMPLNRHWDFPQKDIITGNNTIAGGFCYEVKNGQGKWGPCDIAFSGVKAASEAGPDGATGGFKTGIGMEAELRRKIRLNGGHLSIDIDFWESDADKGLICLTKNYSVVESIGSRVRTLTRQNKDLLTDNVLRGYLRGFSTLCGSFDPENLDYDSFLSEHLDQFEDIFGRVKEEYREIYERHQKEGPKLFHANLVALKRQAAGRQKTFDMTANLNYEIGLDPVKIFGHKETSAGGNFTSTVDVPIRAAVPVPIGPVTIVMQVETKLKIDFKVLGKFGLEWTGDKAPVLGGILKLALTWTPSDGFKAEIDVTGDSRFFGVPSFFGEASVELTASTPMQFAAKLYRSIGPTFTIEPYLTIGIGAAGSTDPTVPRSCDFKLDLGTKASIGGEVTIPVVDKELGKLEGLLFDRCKPTSGAALMPAWMTNSLPEWLCPVNIKRNLCEDNGGGPGSDSDNNWVSLQVGNYSQTSQRRRPESSKAGEGILDIDHIWLEKKGTGAVHFPSEVKGAAVAPERLAYSGSHDAAENMRFHDLNEELSSTGTVVCMNKSGLTTREPTEAEWQTYGLSISGQAIAEVKFPVEIESGDELVLDRHTDHYCTGGGVATLAIGDQAKSKYGAQLTDRAFSGGILRLSVRKGDECQSGSNIICLPAP